MLEDGFDIGCRSPIPLQRFDILVKVNEHCGDTISRRLLTHTHCDNSGGIDRCYVATQQVEMTTEGLDRHQVHARLDYRIVIALRA